MTGTFKFSVSFTDGENSGDDEIVISVTSSPNTAASEAQNKAVVKLIIQTALDTWIYRSGSNIAIQLDAKGGKGPYTWNYKKLPKGLRGNNRGLIQGHIADAGLYSFSASCGDGYGQKAESFYTLNIQPGTLIKSIHYSMQLTTSLMFLIEMSDLSMISNKLRLNKLPLTML